jgi:dimethylhistidine N-methyltransferase
MTQPASDPLRFLGQISMSVGRMLPPAAQLRAMRAEVLEGLRRESKTLPPKFFYDAAGAALFEAICELPEYYLTRSELEILRARADEIADLAGPGCTLVEYGSGAGVKVQLLLDAMTDVQAYIPIDVSREQLLQVSREIGAIYPELAVRPHCADYMEHLALPVQPDASRLVAFFPGSTIGNMHPLEAESFLTRVRRLVGENGAMILGVDRLKHPSVLHAAYNDAAGVTAAFNLNMLNRLNRELGSSFDLSAFEHHGFFNEDARRIEMHLVSRVAQTVCVAGEEIDFAKGETIHTECSYKYDRSSLEDVVSAAGFRVRSLWTDVRERFWVSYLVPSARVPSRGVHDRG